MPNEGAKQNVGKGERKNGIHRRKGKNLTGSEVNNDLLLRKMIDVFPP